jgi:hypothetical protein
VSTPNLIFCRKRQKSRFFSDFGRFGIAVLFRAFLVYAKINVCANRNQNFDSCLLIWRQQNADQVAGAWATRGSD